MLRAFNGKVFDWSTQPTDGYQLDMIDPDQAPRTSRPKPRPSSTAANSFRSG
ncbi:hypothetical protein [Thermococcus peptonophilus]|uniref:hypothetical protein n=1 Tax=Thermococcus peptonophilus TaxID=53952 RepID=UPI000AA4E710